VIVATHQPLDQAGGAAPLLRLIDAAPRVVALLSGHTHRNRIRPRPGPGGGVWQIGTASLADFPQQSRMIRLRATSGGGVVLETWMLDTAPDPGGADVARELAHLDAQGGRPNAAIGRPSDRNVRLFRAAPR
jgi:hypothetical protein